MKLHLSRWFCLDVDANLRDDVSLLAVERMD